MLHKKDSKNERELKYIKAKYFSIGFYVGMLFTAIIPYLIVLLMK